MKRYFIYWCLVCLLSSINRVLTEVQLTERCKPKYITPTPIHYKGPHDNELSDIRNQVSPTSPNSCGWSSEPPSFLSSEPSSPAPTSAGECSMSISLISNDGSQPFSAGPGKYPSNRCLDMDFNDFRVNIDQETRESRGSVSYTDYYSSEDGQIRRTANDNCFPIFVKPNVRSTSTDDGSSADNAEEDEEHTLTLKQAEEQKKQDVQRIFEQKESQNIVKPSSSYKKIGRFRVENMEITDGDARIKEPSSLSSSVSSEKSRYLSTQRKPAEMISKKGNNLLRSQSVYTPKSASASVSGGGGKSPLLAKQISLTGAPSKPEAWQAKPETAAPAEPAVKEQPTLTLASSITGEAHVTVGFNVPQEKTD